MRFPKPRRAPAAVVTGERGVSSLSTPVATQTRITNALALGLVTVLGAGFLSWYYLHAAMRPTRQRRAAQDEASTRAQSEMPLPALGHLALTGATTAAVEPEAAITPVALPMSEAPPPESLPVAASPMRPSTLDRQLAGHAYAAATPGHSDAPAGAAAGSRASTVTAGEGSSEALTPWLQSTATASVQARRLPDQRLLLPKGAFIDCTLETAIDSTLPGMTTCVTATDTFGADGSVVLLDRGTKLVGETRGQVQQGAARVFVLWTEARTPDGVIVPLDSPGADELGRAGLPGEVERHFWQRFGAAILISTLDGAIQSVLQPGGATSGTVIYSPSAAQDVATEALKGSLNIAPTVVKHNGDRIQVLVARDIDFRSVYALRPGAHHD